MEKESRGQSERKRRVRGFWKILDWLLVAVILGGLYVSSSQPYYRQDMRGTIAKVIDESKWGDTLQNLSIEYGGTEVSVEEKGTAGFVEFFLRKGTHVTVFALLALGWYRVLRHRLSFAVALPWAAFFSVMTAALDEWHQTFTPDRTGGVNDVLLDASGSLTMLAIVVLFHMWSHRRQRGKIRYSR